MKKSEHLLMEDLKSRGRARGKAWQGQGQRLVRLGYKELNGNENLDDVMN